MLRNHETPIHAAYNKGEGYRKLQKESRKDITAGTTDVVEFHPCFCGSLLGLEEDRFGFTAARAELVGSWKRRIRSHILSDTRSVSHLTVQLVLVDAVRRSRFADMASATGKHETVVDSVFLGVQQVRAFATESKMNLVGLVIASGGRGRAGRHYFFG